MRIVVLFRLVESSRTRRVIKRPCVRQPHGPLSSGMMDAMSDPDVTRILSQIESGDPDAANQLLPVVYDALRRLAKQRMGMELPDHSLQPTDLVHEAYVRLVDQLASAQT